MNAGSPMLEVRDLEIDIAGERGITQAVKRLGLARGAKPSRWSASQAAARA